MNSFFSTLQPRIRKTGSTILLLTTAFIFQTGISNGQASRPNIIYICANDMGIMDAGYNGNRYYTPNLYRLCARGMVCSEAYAPAATDAPSRASMLTGQYTPRHGVYANANADQGRSSDRKLIPVESAEFRTLENTTIPTDLKRARYKTIHIGKWALSGTPEEHGFDVSIGDDESDGPVTEYFTPFKSGPLQQFNDRYEAGTHRADILADQVIKSLQIYREQPFYIHLSFYSVQEEITRVPKLWEKFDEEKVNVDYASMIEKMDQAVGGILDALDKLGLTDITMVVFTSDNGGIRATSSQAPFRSGKGAYFDGGIRVPLVIQWPDVIKKSFLCEYPINLIDLYPTFMEAARIPVAKDKTLDGVSLIPLMKKEEIPQRPLFWHYPVYEAGTDDQARDPQFLSRPGSAMRLGKWKLFENFEDGKLELYDLAADPSERMNFAAIHPGKTEAMHQQLKEWRESVNAPVPTELNPDYAPQE
ncbi:sulfatase [Pontiellaceae bacterium B12219]|nr:sulfatase [Pontiellaceae bacterium B12219]